MSAEMNIDEANNLLGQPLLEITADQKRRAVALLTQCAKRTGHEDALKSVLDSLGLN